MASKLIRLDDGTQGGILVEVEVDTPAAMPIAGGSASDINKKLSEAADTIQPALVSVCRPIINTWKELNREMSVEQAEVELSLSFDFEGNLYVTKAKAGANFKVKLTLKPKTV